VCVCVLSILNHECLQVVEVLNIYFKMNRLFNFIGKYPLNVCSFSEYCICVCVKLKVMYYGFGKFLWLFLV